MRKPLSLVVPSFVLFIALGCGGKEAPSGGGGSDSPVPTTGGGKPVGDDLRVQGETLAKEALAEFDKAVDEIAEILKIKPDQADAMPKLQAVIDAYRPKMEALAAKRKAFTDPQVKGGFYGAMGSYRGKSIARMDNALGALVAHYRYTKPGPDVVDFLTTKIVPLIEIAHNG
jgi:hypothetical protein